MKCLPILIVEDDRDLRDALCVTLDLAGYAVLAASEGGEALRILEQRRVGLVVSDIQMQPVDGLSLLKAMRQAHPQIPLVLMTAFGDIQSAVTAMRSGASDYLAKPFDPASLLQVVERLRLRPDDAEDDGIVARDPKSGALLALAMRVAASATTVLLSGESGSGKEVLARYVHRHSPRSERPFVAINCAAIPDNLLEATLFGYERGAFTGAAQAQPGKFEQAQGGTLLLDEISEMPASLQAKLLRVLQEREVERLGGRKPIALDVRVIATTNRDLRSCVESGQFRADLYYRLNVFPLHIAPLRERAADIVPLARLFAARHAERLGRSLRLAHEAEQCLLAHRWPGNVRELENVLQRAVILATGDAVEAEQVESCLALSGDAERAAPPVKTGATQPQEELCSAGAPVDMKSLERAHIVETLLAVNGSRKLAVQRLGISERTLRYKLAQYRLDGGLSGAVR